MINRYGATTPFAGLWPATLFGTDPLSATTMPGGCGCSRGALDAFTGGGFFTGADARAFSGLRGSALAPGMQALFQQMQQSDGQLGGGAPQLDQTQQLANLLMQQLVQQMMLQLLIAFFQNGMNAPGAGSPSARGSMGGSGWGGSPRPVSWPSPSRGPSPGRTGQPTPPGRTDGPRSRGQTGIPDGLRANAANGARVVRELGFTGTIGGIGHRSGPSDHPHGNAIDVMTHGDTRMGRQVAEHFRQNHDQLGVKYVIYQQQIASPRTGWQWRPMADRGSPTANHMDHPHISFH